VFGVSWKVHEPEVIYAQTSELPSRAAPTSQYSDQRVTYQWFGKRINVPEIPPSQFSRVNLTDRVPRSPSSIIIRIFRIKRKKKKGRTSGRGGKDFESPFEF